MNYPREDNHVNTATKLLSNLNKKVRILDSNTF